MDINFINNELEKANSIYDFIAIIYYYLSQSDTNVYINNYYKMINNINCKKSLKKLSNLLYDYLMMNDYESEDFLDFKQMWFELFDKNFDLKTYCFATLINFDQNYYGNNSNLLGEAITIQGPLNNLLKNKVLFFNNPPDGYFSDYLIKNGIREGKSKISF